MRLKRILAKNYINAVGWNTKRRLVIIESDDWGSIRMPSRELYECFLNRGVKVDGSYFDKYDSLESAEDLKLLFDVLSSVKDRNGHSAVITPCAVVANPDFDKIEASNKQTYYYELISETYKRYYQTDDMMSLWRFGIENRIFYPQFHGREHINVRRWLEAINSSIEKEQMAFEKRAVISSEIKDSSIVYPLNYFAAFDYDNEEHKKELNSIVKDGLEQFEKLFGFRSVSFVPCCGICGNELSEELAKRGVDFLQCGQQFLPQGNGCLKLQNHFWGYRNYWGQLYWRRNCTFEPSRNQAFDWVDQCLAEIKIAFRWGKPAVINSHRVNFMGSIFPENRDKSLKKLKYLLQEILKHWPDVEFVNSEQLGYIILNNR
ncbi:hypothetical protein [Butyricimonas virosa]|jgi:hypothetical protein|uniref:hypothetical protein n=1 Tax=Butyricimonas virosa TaxID=544645 RepID=UPI0039F63126